MSEWKRVKLRDCIEEINEKTTKNNQYEVLSVTKDGIFSQEEFFKKQIASANNIGYKIIRKNNLVFSTMNLWMGSLDVLTNYDIGIVSPAYKVFEFNENLMISEYGNYFMKSYYMLERYKSCSEQGASVVRRNLDLKALLNVEINLPSIEEQEKIVKILRNIDSIIEKYGLLLEEKSLFIKSQFVEMFGDVINNTKKFDYKPIGEISEIVTGTTPSTSNIENWNGNICWITPAELDNNSIYIFDTERKITEKGQKSKSLKLMPKGTVLFTSRAPIGKVAIIDKEMCCNQGFKNCICKKELNNLYLYYTLKNNAYYFNRLGAGSTFKELSKSTFENVKISVPPMELQSKFAEIVKQIDKQKSLLEKQKQNYENLRKGLMQKLLTGKVRVKI